MDESFIGELGYKHVTSELPAGVVFIGNTFRDGLPVAAGLNNGAFMVEGTDLPNFSIPEIQVLVLRALGQTQEEAALELDRPLETTKKQSARAIHKLEAKNITHAVHTAFMLGAFTCISSYELTQPFDSRERETLEDISHGLLARESAMRHGTGYGTVKNRQQRLFRKAGLRSSAGLITVGHLTGYFEVSSDEA